MRSRMQTLAIPTVTQAEPFRLVQIGAERVRQILQEPNPPHRHEYQEIILIHQGSMVHQLDDLQEEIPSPALVVIPKGRIHKLDPSPDFEGSAIRFHDEFLPKGIPHLLGHRVPLMHCHLQHSQCAQVLDLLRLLGDSERSVNTTRWFLMALLAMLQEWQPHTHTLVHEECELPQWLSLDSAIEAHYTSELAVGEYAKLLGRSERQVNELARKFSGKTVAELVDARRILEAKRLLKYSDLSLKEVAFAIGFLDHSYFTKVFKKHVGQTPSDYRSAAF
jgi:AraC family transcriptional regulator, transcriptional activator of pobA